MNEEPRPPRPPRPSDPPRYAPVVFDDTAEYDDEPYSYDEYDDFDEGPVGGEPPPPRPPRRGGRGPGGGGRGSGAGGYASDAGLFRVMALIAFLGFVIVALVLPWSPISVVGGGGGNGDDIEARERRDLPNLPPGLIALSKMYDITVPEGMEGPWTIDVQLDERTDDPRNMAYYSYEDGQWQRLASVELVGDGRSVSGVLSEAPGSIAVLRRELTAASLGLLVNAGEQPDSAALNGATALAVRGAVVLPSGELDIDADGVGDSRGGAGPVPVFLGITGEADAVLANPATLTAHVEAIAAAVEDGQYGGAYLEYSSIAAGQSVAVSDLVAQLTERLGDDLGVIVGIPAEGGNSYDWAGIIEGGAGIWLLPPADVTAYYQQIENLLGAQLSAGVNLSQVSLVVDRRSTQSTAAGISKITLQGALTAASAVDRGIEGGISTGDPVTLRAVNLVTNPAGPSLRWDPATRTVTYSYDAGDGQRDIWIENRFSFSFRMEVAQRYGLGGVVVDAASANPQLPNVWDAVIAFIEEGEIALEQPFGPYLVPCWEASAGEIEGAAPCWQGTEAEDSVVWRAPAQPGAYDIRLIVSDGTMFVAQELALNVAQESPTTPEPTPTPEPEPTEPPEPEPTEPPEPEPTEPPEPEPTEEPEPTPTDDLPPGPAGDDDDE